MELTVKNTSKHINGMAFYHPEGFVPAYKNAVAFAGEHGRFATLPDIINARILNPGKPGLAPWSRYFTTATAEYLGETAGGNRIIIVAHGNGPMSTLDGILQAYSYHFKDKTRNRVGGRISHEEFRRLESGHYGDVSIVDFADVLRRDQYAFYGQMRASEALAEPLVRARLGWRSDEYIKAHIAMAQLYYDEEAKIAGPRVRQEDPFILSLRAPCNGCSYQYSSLEDGAIAHLLSIGRLQPTGHSEDRVSYTSLLSDVSTHGWHDGTRLAGVRDANSLIGIHPGFDRFEGVLEKHWAEFMKPVAEAPTLGMSPMTPLGKHWFTQHPKVGERMDTGEPEFLVTKREGIPGPGYFTTSEGGGFFLKYGIKEVERIAPRGANAYVIGDNITKRRGEMLMPIKFYRVEVDTSRRLPRMAEIYSDFETIMRVAGKDAEAA
jgi:hypothetical protein